MLLSLVQLVDNLQSGMGWSHFMQTLSISWEISKNFGDYSPVLEHLQHSLEIVRGGTINREEKIPCAVGSGVFAHLRVFKEYFALS